MNQSQLWSELHYLFETDDGYLPEIHLMNLTASQVEHVYSFLRSHGKCRTANPSFYNKESQQDQTLDSVENAATLVTHGIAEPFHLLITGLVFQGATIPDLGVFVFEDSIYLDYQMGAHWGPDEISALFECLRQIKELAPEMRVTLEEYVLPEVQAHFQQVWQQYLGEHTA